MKELIRRSLAKMQVGTGLTYASRRLRSKPGTMILYGHRVQDDDEGYLQGLKPEWFADQVEYLARNYEIISLTALVECFEKGTAPPADSVVITFDDGFRDNFEGAFPLLEARKIPVTVFLTTGSIDTGQLPWSQRLGWMMQNTEKDTVTDIVNDGPPLRFDGPRGRSQSYQKVKRTIRRLSAERRERILGTLEETLDVEPPRDRMLTWDQARAMQSSGLVEFGAHTVTHPLLALQTTDEARRELEMSKSALEAQLGVERPNFAFPGGSFNADLVEMVRQVGFRSVFQSRSDLRFNNLQTTNQFALSRVGLPEAPAWVLEAELDGLFHPVRQLYRRGD